MIGGFHKIPEAIKVAIAAETFSETLTVKRRTLIYAESEKSQTLTCYVAPISVTTTEGTRASQGHDWVTAVYLVEQVIGADIAEKIAREDALLTVTDEVMAFINGLKSITVDGTEYPVQLLPSEGRPPVEEEGYITSKTFVSSFQVLVKE